MSLVQQFHDTYNSLNAGNVAMLEELYDARVLFVDPLHRVEGIEALKRYMASMYKNVESCRFHFQSVVEREGEAMVCWEMEMRHRRLARGKTIVLPGASHLRFSDRITYHRDYFDVGALIYERVPLLGGLVRAIKRRA